MMHFESQFSWGELRLLNTLEQSLQLGSPMVFNASLINYSDNIVFCELQRSGMLSKHKLIN
jgi:hypothetical protein